MDVHEVPQLTLAIMEGMDCTNPTAFQKYIQQVLRAYAAGNQGKVLFECAQPGCDARLDPFKIDTPAEPTIPGNTERLTGWMWPWDDETDESAETLVHTHRPGVMVVLDSEENRENYRTENSGEIR